MIKVYLTEKQCSQIISMCLDKQVTLYQALEERNFSESIVDLVERDIQQHHELELLLKSKESGEYDKNKAIADRCK